MALERESIMVTDTLDIQRLFASWKKPAGSSRCRYPAYMVGYIIVVTRLSQIAAKERLSFSMSASTREFRDSCTLNVNLSRVFFTLFDQGDYSMHA